MGWILDDPFQHPLKKELYMTREDRLSIIYDAFDACAERFCVSTGGSFHEIIPIYKGRADSRELKYRSAFIYYKSFLVQLKYTAHCTLGVTNSVLECLVHRSKENDSIAIPLPLLLSYIANVFVIVNRRYEHLERTFFINFLWFKVIYDSIE